MIANVLSELQNRIEYDNTFYSSGIELSRILEDLTHNMKTVLKWFGINSLKANPGKFQFIILGKKQGNEMKLTINLIVITNFQ